jgi:acetyltransferase-like isoleucine patch superfamily enzyme
MAYLNNDELVRMGFNKLGSNVKISNLCSIYSPETIILGDNVRIDDFCCLSGGEKGITLGSNIHIAAYCAIYGKGGVILKDFSGLSSRVVIYSVTDDYSGQHLTNPTIPEQYLNVITGQVILNKHVIIGTNSTVLPNVEIGEGAAVGAHSLVNKNLSPWGIYFGVPVRKLTNRSNELLNLEQHFCSENPF